MNREERLELGRRTLAMMAGRQGEKMVADLEENFPELAHIVLGFGFGEIYAREGLSIPQKEMLSIACLVAQGDTAGQLRFHFMAALHSGLSKNEVIETLIHCIPHVGVPKVMNAFHALASVLKENPQE
ncbi:carboxymuconolactone decarboxylase family protein [Paenibacillus sp. P26]|nr:carboxymuconolactone decarboxylase family protein [Paenibacillus sp. P26]